MEAKAQDDRLVYTSEEMLSCGEYSEPLIANGVRCHGGFDESGTYRSPRVINRNPAVSAWQAQLKAAGHELVQIPEAMIPPQYPNVAQSKLLLKNDIQDPIVRALTVISIVEGFGAVIRDVPVPDLKALFVEPIDGTAMAHLDKGLFEAHARDEAGFRDEGGHKQMWEAARDLGLDNPKIPSDVLMRLMGNRARGKRPEPLFPQLDKQLYRMLNTMSQVLVIEIFAKGTFDWGVDLLSDGEVSANPKEAGDMVRYIRDDESPHVAYLRTALSETRARTLRTVDGETIAGKTVVDGMLHHILSRMSVSRPSEQRDDTRASFKTAMKDAKHPASLLEEFDALQTKWTPPQETGFAAASAA